MLLVPMIFVHLAVIFYAMDHGLTADAILSRTRGSVAWGLFYGIFVLLAAAHASIGVRNILQEWGRLRDRAAGQLAVSFGILLVLLGLRAVVAVVMP
jgi:fumarate reductase subunit C